MLGPDLQVGLTCASALIIAFALTGNGLVLFIVATRSHMRNSTNILIANMAIADILMALDLVYVSKWLFIESEWFGGLFGAVTCKLLHSMQALTVACSVFTLAVISLDRCLVLLFPLHLIFSRSRVLKSSIAAIWFSAVAIALPLFIYTEVTAGDGGMYFCNEHWSNPDQPLYYTTAFVACAYFLPLVVISVAYTLVGVKLWTRELPGQQTLEAQKKLHETARKATLMLVTVVVVFALCWFPFQVREVLLYYNPRAISKMSVRFQVVLPWIGFSSSAINPFLYVVFSENYRREFQGILCCYGKGRNLEVYQGIPLSKRTPQSTPLFTRKRFSLFSAPH